MEVCFADGGILSCGKARQLLNGANHVNRPMPSDGEIQLAIRRLAKQIDLDDASLNEIVVRLSQEMGGVDLFPKKAFIKDALSARVHETFPTDQEIGDAVALLSQKVNIDDTSFKQFVELLSIEMGTDLSSKAGLIKQEMSSSSALVVPEAKAERVQVEQVQAETSPKKFGMVSSERKVNVNAVTTIATASTVMASPEAPREISKQVELDLKEDTSELWRRSEDLEQGAIIPAAAGMKWKDDFFDGEQDLVAVFDHDYKVMIDFELRIAFLRKIPAIVVAVFAFAVAVTMDYTAYGVYVLLSTAIILGIHQFGVYRLANSSIRALHVAVLRDGVHAVHDDHLAGRPFFAGLYLACNTITEKSETVRARIAFLFSFTSHSNANNTFLMQIKWNRSRLI